MSSVLSHPQAHCLLFKGLTEKQAPHLRDLNSRVTAGGKGVTTKEYCFIFFSMWPYVRLLICTYIMYVHEGLGQRNKEHSTYMSEKGKMCQGTEEALLILWGTGVVDRGPL